MSHAPFISVEHVNRKVYEAETDGLFVILTLLDAPENVEKAPDDAPSKTFDCLCIDGDGEKSYELLVVGENADMVTEIRTFVNKKLEDVTSRQPAHLIIEREDERKRALRSIPLIRTRYAHPDYVVTADDLIFTFQKDTSSAPKTKNGAPYALFSYREAGGKLAGEVEIVGDHNPIFEFAPVVEAHLIVRAARKQLAKEIGDNR